MSNMLTLVTLKEVAAETAEEAVVSKGRIETCKMMFKNQEMKKPSHPKLKICHVGVINLIRSLTKTNMVKIKTLMRSHKLSKLPPINIIRPLLVEEEVVWV